MKNLVKTVVAMVSIMIIGNFAFAGTTGKIVGTVIDSETKEPIPGAVIQLLGTELGANSDMDGRYMINNVPVGTYSLQARMMGYEGVTVTNIKSIMDLTTTINFKLKPTVLQVEGITITATRQMVIADATSTTRTTSKQEILALPGASATTAIQQTAGVVSQAGAMNVRGGRSDEMAYFIDGVVVNDPLQGRVGAQINTSAIEEVMVITGGFNAEYGEAMSGIVNVVTREGSDKFSGSLKYTTDEFMLSDSRNYNKIEGSFGGGIPFVKNAFFFFSGEYNNTNDQYNHFMPDKYYVHDPSKDYFWGDTLRYSQSSWDTLANQWTGEWVDSSDAAWAAERERRLDYFTMKGWELSDKPYLPHTNFNTYRLQGKLTYKINPINAKLSLGGFANRDQRGLYAATWKYHLDGLPYELTKSYQVSSNWRQQVNNKTFYNVILNHFNTAYRYGNIDTVAEKTRNFWEDYTFLSDNDLDYNGTFDAYDGQDRSYNIPDNPYGYISSAEMSLITRGLYRRWEMTEARYHGFKFDITSQANRSNQVQAGLEYKQHRMYRKYNSLPADPDPFKDSYTFKPVTGAAYLQDKLEFEGFIINAGLRFDYVDSKAEYYIYQFNPDSGKIAAETKWKLSPRLGISHPITERTVFHLSYGHFFQQPQFQYLYETLEADVISRGNSIVGSPDLASQKTIAYEAGLSHQFNTDLAGDLTIYYKDLFDLLSGRTVSDTVTGKDYFAYVNGDYGNVRGAEIAIQKRAAPGGIFSGRASYSLSMARGSASDPIDGYYNWRGIDPITGLLLEPPKVDYYLEFDQRHGFNLSTNFDLGDGYGPRMLGFKPLSNVSISLLNNLASGFPYSRTDSKGKIIGEFNGYRTPWTWNMDLMASKDFSLGQLGFSLNLEVFNLLNRKNVANVFAQTGLNDNDGRLKTISEVFPTSDSIWAYKIATTDSAGNNVLVPNEYYSKWADADSNGYINREEKYGSYVNAWNDMVTDPRNGNRQPYSAAYYGPRRLRLSLSFNF
jgi:outer membrane receptor for ferrienterochelin and colicin